MATLAFAMPVLPGKEDAHRQYMQSVSTDGPEHDAYVAARRAQGFTSEVVSHQATPNGTMSIVVLESDDPARAMGEIVTADTPFAREFRAHVQDVHGVDLASDPPPEVELISDMSF